MKLTILKGFLIFFLFCFPSLSGCIDFDDVTNIFDPVIRRADPYIEKISFDDESLKIYALSIIKEINASNKEAIVTAIYRHIVENYSYISDPNDKELIRSPQETIHLKGGDCEDLSILLISLLENINIKTYLILTDDHAYALAYDINIDKLWSYVETALINQVEKDSGEQIRQKYQQTFPLRKHQIWYYGGEGNSITESESFDYINFTYSVQPKRPIDFYIVPSRQDFLNYSDNKPFDYYKEHSGTNTNDIEGTCSYMLTYGGIILSNNNWLDTEVTVNLTFYSHPSFYKLFENKTIQSYSINNKNCIVLEPTAGVYGYPGYDANVTGQKTAIDPLTKEYFHIEWIK